LVINLNKRRLVKSSLKNHQKPVPTRPQAFEKREKGHETKSKSKTQNRDIKAESGGYIQ